MINKINFRGGRLFQCVVGLAAASLIISLGERASAQSVQAGKKEVWAEVDRLAGEQKLQAALDKVVEMTKSGALQGDSELTAEAIIRGAQLKIGLHGYETAVRELKAAAWPKEPKVRILLGLYYAHALMSYHQMYNWEIRTREKTVSSKAVDLKAWTTEQLGNAIGTAFDEVMKDGGAALDGQAPEFFQKYFNKNNYPAGIRPTLRDAVVYMVVEHLRNTQYWTASQLAEVYRIEIEKQFEGTGASSQRVAAGDERIHPLLRIASWLNDHREFHTRAGRIEAVMETRYVLLDVLYSAMTESADRIQIRSRLQKYQEKYSNLPWWSRGQAMLADFVRQDVKAGALIEARKVAKAGQERHPTSYGGQVCAAIINEIERPEFRMNAMATDGGDKPSILIQHKNLSKLFFRAYQLDLEALLKNKKDGGDLLLSDEAFRPIRDGRSKHVSEWNVSLSPTPDFASHRKLVVPKLPKPGGYVILASAKSDFTGDNNVVLSSRFLYSNLVLSVGPRGDQPENRSGKNTRNSIEVRAQFGDVGTAAPGAAVSLYRFQWNKPTELVETKTTGTEGYVHFDEPTRAPNDYWNYFVFAKKGDALSYRMDGIYFSGRYSEGSRSASLVFTDRSVYRPDQKVFWKAVLYSGVARDGKLKTAEKGTRTTVRFYDPNYQIVGTVSAVANEFGTISGEFKVPTGRPLGSWQINLESFTGAVGVRVEEYKRPTFETTITDSIEPLRLNKAAKIKGEAKYYFGLPVTSGTVKWRVTREAQAPWWWGYFGRSWWSPPAPPQTVATGISSLKADGSYEISFLPQADERKNSDQSKDITYSFNVEANVTDDGGETRTGNKFFRIGFVSVEATLTWSELFFDVGNPFKIESRLSSLDGKPKKGSASYKLVRLKAPTATMPPASYARDVNSVPDRDTYADFAKYSTADDAKRARWDTDFRWESLAASWEDGETVKSGSMSHDVKGEAVLSIDKIDESGVYKIYYETKDDFGVPYKVSRLFIVGEKKSSEAKPKIPLPLLVLAQRDSYEVGETARVLVHTGLTSQPFTLEVFRDGRSLSRKHFVSSKAVSVHEFPIKLADRGGFTVAVRALRDHQLLRSEVHIFVPWTDRTLGLDFSTFRDKLRPGTKETFRVTVKNPDKSTLKQGPAEVLAYMYDRSLDIFAPHVFPSVSSLYPSRVGAYTYQNNLGIAYGSHLRGNFHYLSRPSHPQSDALQFYNNYGVGGPGSRNRYYGMSKSPRRSMREEDSAPASEVASAPSALADSSASNLGAMAAKSAPAGALAERSGDEQKKKESTGSPSASAAEGLRSNFSETAFFQPHLVTDKEGSVGFEFEVPDSVTSWRVFAHAITKDVRGGSVSKETKSVKELMVRPYAPRFLREADEAEIKVVINNAGESSLSGELKFEIEDLDKGGNALADFGIKGKEVKRPFTVEKSGSVTLGFPLKAPKRVGLFAFKVLATATAGGKVKGVTFSDGERRPFPVLPSRMHLAQSRFVTLKNASTKVLEFKDLAKGDDKTLLNEKMVVTIDAQLFYGVLKALPYLVKYPYECTEQTLNRFLSTGIVSSLFKKYPSIEKMAKDFSSRKSQFEKFDDADANRRMTLEESPWLQTAQGGATEEDDLLNVLDSRIAKSERDRALTRLKKLQLPAGAFPWFEGGPPDPYMTVYTLMGFGRALEFKVDVPKDVIVKAWRYTRQWLDGDLERMMSHGCCWEMITLINYAVSQYPDETWSDGMFDTAYRTRLLNYSFKHWKLHSPLLKGYLALTLLRSNRKADAKLVWDSVMDSSKSDDQLGTYWAQEDRSWLWYNDTIETHAFSLRTLMEMDPKDSRSEGLVQWLFLNKKLNHWKSTRATSEVIYSLAHYLDETATLGNKEVINVDLGSQKTEFVFEPDKYTGKKNQIVVPGEKVIPGIHSKITVSKSTPGFAFASAVWHFSTEELPKEASGDFFNISRKYFKRENSGKEWVLKPLAEGEQIRVGDQIEVQISIQTKHEAEYVHLRDPRAAGLEPENPVSGYKYDLGIYWFEETRDSGANFFFNRLPVGEYTFRYRLRANMSGNFRVGPATIQSMYAPEFNAYSAGKYDEGVRGAESKVGRLACDLLEEGRSHFWFLFFYMARA